MGRPDRRDEAWFTRIYAAHHTQVVHYGRRRLADTEAAAELAQEVFVVAWRRRADVPDRALPWLYGVARRLLANHWRASKAAPEVGSIVDYLPETEPSGCGAADRVAEVRAALSALSDADQEILRLVGWEELTVSEAAQVLGCSRTTAAVRLHRARRWRPSFRTGSPGTTGCAIYRHTDMPGLLWRGTVTDRAGRTGVAITFDHRSEERQYLLILHPDTGELLADEEIELRPARLGRYTLIIETDRSDHIG